MTVTRVDGNKMTEQDAEKIFGKQVNRFYKAVAKAAKQNNIDAYALWTYHNSAMRVVSFGHDETGRMIALNVAGRIADITFEVLKEVDAMAETKGHG